MGSLYSATVSKAEVAIRIRQSQRWVLGLGKANMAPPWSGGKRSLSLYIKTVSHGIFICSCYPYSDLCLTSIYFITSVFYLPSSIFLLILWSSEPLAFLSSVFHPPFVLQFLIAYFWLPSSILCSFVPFLLLSFHHLSIISCLPFPTLTT